MELDILHPHTKKSSSSIFRSIFQKSVSSKHGFKFDALIELPRDSFPSGNNTRARLIRIFPLERAIQPTWFNRHTRTSFRPQMNAMSVSCWERPGSVFGESLDRRRTMPRSKSQPREEKKKKKKKKKAYMFSQRVKRASLWGSSSTARRSKRGSSRRAGAPGATLGQ